MDTATKVVRTESKFIISPIDAALLRIDLNALLKPDKYSENGAYRVKSLYFDSINNKDYVNKINGVYARSKIRLRIYDEDDSVVKLEEKIKNGIYQTKNSLTVSKEDGLQLISGKYDVLYKYNGPVSERFYFLMVMGIYKPVVIVEYKRIAYTFPEFNTRITIDTDLLFSELDLCLFERNNNWTSHMNDAYILEVKYDGRFVKSIADIIGKYSCRLESVGKYCLGRPIYQDIIYN